MRAGSTAFGLLVLQLLAGAAAAAECPHRNALGTARTLEISSREMPRVGLKHFPTSLPLQDKEVVLTFDDGPFPPTTRRVLTALADQCVHATFFLIGRNAVHSPDIVRRIAADGHTIAFHSWSHRILSRIPPPAAEDEIDRGIAAVEAAVKGKTEFNMAGLHEGAQPTRFFRFPGFASTPALLSGLNGRNIVVFGADLWASDWNRMSPDEELRQAITRLKAARKGIILFHDIKAQTAAMLPAFLQFLKDNGYRIVHAVPSGTVN